MTLHQSWHWDEWEEDCFLSGDILYSLKDGYIGLTDASEPTAVPGDSMGYRGCAGDITTSRFSETEGPIPWYNETPVSAPSDIRNGG